MQVGARSKLRHAASASSKAGHAREASDDEELIIALTVVPISVPAPLQHCTDED